MQLRTRFLLLGLVALLGSASVHASGHAPEAPIKVVYHLDLGRKGTTTALHQAKNQLTAAPNTKIVVVVLGSSMHYMVKGAETAGGYPFALMISDLQDRGVRFEACHNTMMTLHIKASQLDPGIHVVPSGMAEIARLEAREGYAYIRP